MSSTTRILEPASDARRDAPSPDGGSVGDRRSSVTSTRRLAIMAYGSLIHTPGPDLEPLIRARRVARTPFRVEYGRVSPRWGGGPVLVPHPAGANVMGMLLLLRDEVTLGQAVAALARREGTDPRHIVEAMLGPGVTALVADLPRNLADEEMTPEALAERAIGSAHEGPCNGVVYLRRALRSGVVTPRSLPYARAVCAALGVTTLEEAERTLDGLVASPGHSGKG